MMKPTFYFRIPALLLFLSVISCNPRKDPPGKNCDFAVSYKVDGQLVTHDETEVTAEIWPASAYAVQRKVYDIWTDEAPGLNFHSSASGQDEISHHVNNWQTEIGTRILLNAVGLESQGLSFKIIREAHQTGDLLQIEFHGTTPDGKHITEGLICTYIDITH